MEIELRFKLNFILVFKLRYPELGCEFAKFKLIMIFNIATIL